MTEPKKPVRRRTKLQKKPHPVTPRPTREELAAQLSALGRILGTAGLKPDGTEAVALTIAELSAVLRKLAEKGSTCQTTS